jgi:hypothetical protein
MSAVDDGPVLALVGGNGQLAERKWGGPSQVPSGRLAAFGWVGCPRSATAAIPHPLQLAEATAATVTKLARQP